ncbi:MAG: hypothetical protein ACYTG4_00735, partial [Planctomycetota bacterium]
MIAGLGAWEFLASGDEVAQPPGEPSGRTAEIEAALAGVQSRFLAVEQVALDTAAALTPRILEAVPHPTTDPDDRARLFAALETAVGEPTHPVSGVSIVDDTGSPLAWRGRVFEGRRVHVPGEEPSTRIVRTDVYKVVVAEEPLVGPGGTTAAAVRVYAPFNANFPLDNRFLRRIDFEREAAETFDLEDVDLSFSDAGGGETVESGVGRAALEGALGTRHATLEVTLLPSAEKEARARGAASRSRRAVLASLLILVLAFGLLPVGAVPRGPWRALARCGAILGARALLLLLNMPRDLVEGPLFDPASFSVTWLGGALSTPGDALLTMLALMEVARRIGRCLPAHENVTLPQGYAFAVLSPLVLWYGGHVWIELARTVAFQSQVDLFPEGRILASPAAVALHLTVGSCIAAVLFLAVPMLRSAWGRAFVPKGMLGRGLLLVVVAAPLVHLSVQWQALQALRTDALAEVEYD